MGSRLFSVYSLCLLNLASYECITYSLNKFEYKNTYGCQGLLLAVLNQNLYGSGGFTNLYLKASQVILMHSQVEELLSQSI